jgi:hypothetical protein
MMRVFCFVVALACLASVGCGDQSTLRKPDQPAPLPTAAQRHQVGGSAVPARMPAKAER